MISSGTIDSPSWELVRIAKLANRIYAPLGTRMTLGDYVRGIRRFLDALKPQESLENDDDNTKIETSDRERENDLAELAKLRNDLKVRKQYTEIDTTLNTLFLGLSRSTFSLGH